MEMELEFALTLNESYNDTDIGPGCPRVNIPIVYVVAQVVYALVCVVGLAGNSLVIYVVVRYSKMQTVTNLYILNLAVADECFLIGIPFLVVTMSLRTWPFGRTACQLYMVSTGVNQFTSSVFLCIMSADRYVAVCHPIAAPRLRTPAVARAVAAVAWTASALLMTPFFMYTTLVENEHGSSCNIVWPGVNPMSSQSTFIIYSFAFSFAAPLTLIFLFYLLVIRRLRTVGPAHRKRRSHRKVTRLVLTVIAVYVLCWLPYWAYQVALSHSASTTECVSRVSVTISLVAGCFSYSNSAVNPILYAFLSDNFKKSFLKACSCAATRDANATLQPENSAPPPHRRRTSSRPAPPTMSDAFPLETRPLAPPQFPAPL